MNISGQKIRQIRAERKMQQIDLSAALDVDFGLKLSQSDISEIERGKRGAKDYELQAIAKILNINIDSLLKQSLFNRTRFYIMRALGLSH